jgi:hypothetical protein
LRFSDVSFLEIMMTGFLMTLFPSGSTRRTLYDTIWSTYNVYRSTRSPIACRNFGWWSSHDPCERHHGRISLPQ